MNYLKQYTSQAILFVMVDESGTEVTGLTALDVELSINGAAFADGAGTVSEIGSGWYNYTITADETATLGPVAIRITADGCVQQNLLYQVVPVTSIPEYAGDTILTAGEAARVLRCAEDDDRMLDLLPQVDAYLLQATGHNWASDSTVRQEAKSAARMLLVMWYENPGMIGGMNALSFGLRAALTQLEAIAERYIEFQGLSSAGFIYIPGLRIGYSVVTVEGIIGVSGDQAAAFESVISSDDYIQQTSDSDLSENWYRAYILTPGEL